MINAKYKFCLDLFKRWGYTFVDEIVWVKMTRNRRLAKSHGFYLQHAKEVCLVAKIGDDPPNLNSNIGSDIIMRCASLVFSAYCVTEDVEWRLGSVAKP